MDQNGSHLPQQQYLSYGSHHGHENGSSEHAEGTQTASSSMLSSSSAAASFMPPMNASMADMHDASSSWRSCLLHAIDNIRSQWPLILFGQLVSLLISATGAAQSTLALECHLSAPTFALGCMYLGLTASLIPHALDQWQCKLKRIQGDSAILQQQQSTSPIADAVAADDETDLPGASISTAVLSNNNQSHFDAPYSFCGIGLQTPPRNYFMMALLDVYAQYFTVLAFKYTTITSVELFVALAIPSAMILSRLFLARQYTSVHLLGVMACMVGILFNVLQDYHDDTLATQNGDNDDLVKEYPHKTIGDFLSITGGLLLGASNVVAEVAVRNFGGPNEYIGMLGVFGVLICTVQTVLLERDEVAAFFGNDVGHSETCQRREGWWLLLGFVISAVCSYNGVSRFLLVSEAAFLNLSLLTGDLWSVLFSVFGEGITPKPMFFIALIFILSGVVVYEMAPTPVAEDREKLHNDSDIDDRDDLHTWRRAGFNNSIDNDDDDGKLTVDSNSASSIDNDTKLRRRSVEEIGDLELL